MTCRLVTICFDANDPLRLARFWGGVPGREIADDPRDGVVLLPNDDTGFRFRFLPTQEQKTGLNERHFHLTSTSLEDQHQTVARSLRLGAGHIDFGQRPQEGHVVADPEGIEFCVIEPGNNRLAGCRFTAGRVLLEQSAGLAAGLGSGSADRDPRAAGRSEDLLGRVRG